MDGALPVPRREVAVLLRQRREGRLLLLRVSGQGRCHRLRARDRGPRLRRFGRVPGRQGGRRSAVHRPSRGPESQPAQGTCRARGAGGGVLPPAAPRPPRGPSGPRLPAIPWLRQRRGPSVQHRVGAGRVVGSVTPPSPGRRRVDGHRPRRHQQERRPVRLLPLPDRLPDLRRSGQRHRVRGSQAPGRRGT